LAVDPVRATSTGSVEGPDVILISDNSDSGNLKSATLSTVSNYMQGALTFTSPGGSNTQVQYNNSGGFAGSSAFIFNAATETVTTTNLTASGHVSASSFHGNGSALVGVTATATPAGSNSQIQLNTDGSTGASANLTFLTSSNILAVSGQISGTLGITGSVGFFDVIEVGGTTIDSTQISSSLNLSASAFYGDGSNLSGVGGTAWNAFNSNYNVVSTHDVMGIDTSGSVVTASLPGAADLSAGKRLVFKDVGGSGSINNIVIEASGSQTIDGASTVKIQANYGAITLSTDGVAAYYIISTT